MTANAEMQAPANGYVEARSKSCWVLVVGRVDVLTRFVRLAEKAEKKTDQKPL